MDTVTQALLGGAVGYMVAGKKSPRKAVLWGAAIAVLPDLDIFIPHETDLASMTLHRSWSHSWFVQTAVAPLLAILLHRFDKTFSYFSWFLMTWLALITHSGLDALTVYGTQLFWPLMPSPVSGGSVFIIDPTYSIPLLIGFLTVLIAPDKIISTKLMRYTFAFSCVYLTWGLLAQQWVEHQAKSAFAEQGIEVDQMQVSATAFNTLLWRVIAVNDKHYFEGFHSVFEGRQPIIFKTYDRGAELIDKVEHYPAYKRIDWFTNGLFKLELQGDHIVASDLRMGMEPSYFFRFNIAEKGQHQYIPSIPNRFASSNHRKEGVRWVWQRIWNPAVEFNPQLN